MLGKATESRVSPDEYSLSTAVGSHGEESGLTGSHFGKAFVVWPVVHMA